MGFASESNSTYFLRSFYVEKESVDEKVLPREDFEIFDYESATIAVFLDSCNS